jgi:hypothetical protein
VLIPYLCTSFHKVNGSRCFTLDTFSFWKKKKQKRQHNFFFECDRVKIKTGKNNKSTFGLTGWAKNKGIEDRTYYLQQKKKWFYACISKKTETCMIMILCTSFMIYLKQLLILSSTPSLQITKYTFSFISIQQFF